MKDKLDYIVVGQGIAGSMLAHALIAHGKNIMIMDEHNPNSSSNIAAGVVNPITGRKMVKTWMIDEVLPYAIKTYQALEELLCTGFFYKKELIKIFSAEEDVALWKKKQQDPEYTAYMGDIIPSDKIHPSIQAPFGAGVIRQACWLDVPELVAKSRIFFAQKNCLLEEKLDYAQLEIKEDVRYKGIIAGNIIFCEGYKAYENPFFSWIPFALAKGEHIVVRSESLVTDDILNKNIFIIPKGNHLFNIGSTFIWDDMEECVTAAGRAEILHKFRKISAGDFTIVEERAAIRPAMCDRRPVIGRHPKYPNLYVFNGMGTKGVSLSPYFADYFVRYLEEGFTIIPEISLERFGH